MSRTLAQMKRRFLSTAARLGWQYGVDEAVTMLNADRIPNPYRFKQPWNAIDVRKAMGGRDYRWPR